MTKNEFIQAADRDELRGKSEYIRTVEDFARYVNKEYIGDTGQRSLLICAADRTIGSGKAGIGCIVLGNKVTLMGGLTSMMQQEETSGLFRAAYVASISDDGDDFEGVIRMKRRKLRTDCVLAAVLSLWTLGLAVIGIAGVIHWALSLTCLLLMACAHCMIWPDVIRGRRAVGRLESRRVDVLKEKARIGLAAIVSDFLGRLQRNDDED